MVVTLKNGSIWRLLGSDKMEVVGAGPVGVVFSEFALAKPRTWDLIRPMLRENEGWAWMITTPRGKNHAFKLYEMARKDPKWFCDLKTLIETRAYDPDETIAEERASGMPEELIEQEYLCSFTAANVGAFWGAALAQLEKRGGVCAFESGKDDVFTSWDLGKTDDTAIWWWRVREDGGIDVLDHYASHGENLEHYWSVIRSRARTHGWVYRQHFFPHDAAADTLVSQQTIIEHAAGALPLRQSMAPGSATPVHQHDCEEVVLVLSGSGEVRANGTATPFGPDSTLVLPPRVAHESVNTGDSPLVTVAVFSATPVGTFTPNDEKIELPWAS
jgi:quercetin dioxygenase-like cupin family protein